MTDQEIIDCVLEGDRAAFDELVRRYQDSVYRMALRRTRCDRDAEDVAQEVFLNVYRRLATFRGSAKFTTWLYRITFNTCVDWVRRARRIQTTRSPADEEYADSRIDIAADFFDAQERSALGAAVSCLSEPYREVIELYYYEHLSYAEIGAILGMAGKGVETRLYRARRALRRLLQEKGHEM